MGVKVAKGQQPKIADENIWCLKVIKLFHELRTTKGKTPIELDKKEYKDVWRTPTSKLLVKPEIGFELEHKDDTKGAVSNGVTLDPNDTRLIQSISLNNILNIEQYKFFFDQTKVAEYEVQLWLCYIPAHAIYYEGFNDILTYPWRKGHLTPKEDFSKNFTHHIYYDRQYTSSSIIFQRRITSFEELQQLMLEEENLHHSDEYLREESQKLESFPDLYDVFCKEGTIKHPIHVKELETYKTIVAFDFETVVYQHKQRACSIGISKAVDGKIVDTKSFLIQPPQNFYDDNTVKIHHITPDMTACSPSFAEIWPTIKEIFDTADVILYHSGCGFDISVLNNEAEFYQIPFDERDYNFIDTCNIFHAGLAPVSKAYGIDITYHHNADADAQMCLECYIRYINGIQPDENMLEAAKAEEKERPHKPSETFMEEHQALHGSILKKDLSGADPTNPYYDKKVVISGVFYKPDGTKYDRNNIAAKLKSCGADIDTSVGKYTQILFAGEAVGKSKLKGMQSLLDSGKDVKILGQQEITKLMEVD